MEYKIGATNLYPVYWQKKEMRCKSKTAADTNLGKEKTNVGQAVVF